MEKKEIFESVEIEIVNLPLSDVIATSGNPWDPFPGPDDPIYY